MTWPWLAAAGTLRARILEVAAWHAHGLRTPELRGRDWAPGRTEALVPRGLPLHEKSRDEQRAIVESVVAIRRGLVAQLQGSVIPLRRLPRGRLLLFRPQDTVLDTLSNYASRGLFDDHDEVGWDWWLGMHEAWSDGFDLGGVIAWIPEEHRAQAEAGIDVNPVACLRWIRGRSVVLRGAERRRG